MKDGEFSWWAFERAAAVQAALFLALGLVIGFKPLVWYGAVILGVALVIEVAGGVYRRFRK